MRKNATKLVSIAILILLTLAATGCNLFTAAPTPNYIATQTMISLLSMPILNTPTVTLAALPTSTATLDPISISQTQFSQGSVAATLTPVPLSNLPTAGPKPSSYTLQSGEFPYCIARRFNVDPKELLTLNGLTSGLIYSPGLVLVIPQSGRPFPASRALHLHPSTFTVSEYATTVYKVACYYGDIDPVIIVQYNGLTSPILSVGQVLKIP